MLWNLPLSSSIGAVLCMYMCVAELSIFNTAAEVIWHGPNGHVQKKIVCMLSVHFWGCAWPTLQINTGYTRQPRCIHKCIVKSKSISALLLNVNVCCRMQTLASCVRVLEWFSSSLYVQPFTFFSTQLWYSIRIKIGSILFPLNVFKRNWCSSAFITSDSSLSRLKHPPAASRQNFLCFYIWICLLLFTDSPLVSTSGSRTSFGQTESTIVACSLGAFVQKHLL